MVKVEGSSVLNAPVEKVFDYLSDPHSNVDVIPGMVDVRDIEDPPNHVGGHFHWTYKMAGIKFDGETRILEWEKNRRVVTESRGGIRSKWTISYEPAAPGTKMTVAVEYEVPVPVLGRLAESLVKKQNEKELELMLSNVKTRVEGA